MVVHSREGVGVAHKNQASVFPDKDGGSIGLVKLSLNTLSDWPKIKVATEF